MLKKIFAVIVLTLLAAMPVLANDPGKIASRQELLAKLPAEYSVSALSGNAEWGVVKTENGYREVVVYGHFNGSLDAIDEIITIGFVIESFTRYAILPSLIPGMAPAVVSTLIGEVKNGKMVIKSTFDYQYDPETLDEVVNSVTKEVKDVLESLEIATNEGLAAYIQKNIGGPKTGI